MIMLFFSKKFWLAVFALVVLNYSCNRIERRAGQAAQTKKLFQSSMLHDLKVKVMALNSMLEELRLISTFDAPVLAECTQLRTELFKIKNEAGSKTSSQMEASLKDLDGIEKRVLEITIKIETEKMKQFRKQLQTTNDNIKNSLTRYADAEKNLEDYQSNPLLHRFLK